VWFSSHFAAHTISDTGQRRRSDQEFMAAILVSISGPGISGRNADNPLSMLRRLWC
jgi:hypothetical protein